LNLWWRDDDAEIDDPRLDQLLAIAKRRSVPVVLAVVPARLDGATIRKILACPFASVVQHGLAHTDHRSEDGRKCELVDRVDQDEALIAARESLAILFGDRFQPVMAPPWNRIEPGLRARLPSLGYLGLSTFAGRRAAPRIPNLRLVDTHVDAICWRNGKQPLNAEAIVSACQDESVRADGPIGLLTHHAVTDEDGFVALDRAIGLLQDRHKARFVSGSDLFAE
jgi:hypothetical protein